MSATLCALTDLQPDQCAHCRHREGGPDPYAVEQLNDLGTGRSTSDATPVDLRAAGDLIVAARIANFPESCGWCNGRIIAGQIIGVDLAGAHVCPDCLPPPGHPPTHHEKPDPEPVPVPIPDLLERTARTYGGPPVVGLSADREQES